MGILSTFFNAVIRSAGHDAYRSTKRVVTDVGKQTSRRTAIEADYDVNVMCDFRIMVKKTSNQWSAVSYPL